ncbi:MAG: polyphosphate polymerase domain-containing protein [Clostridia bacterium]|nr:polyphosphate polymerase domain-containing protein [Clostridia bacterium]
MKKIETTYIFQRVEKKYLLSEDKYFAFLEEIEPYMKTDSYGLTTICNIYFDTEHYDLIRNSLDKPPYKEKLRLRSYGIPKEDSTVFLEVKKKCYGTVYKRRVAMTAEEAGKYLETRKKPACYSQILKEIDYFLDYYQPEKKLYLAYDRIAYREKEGDSLRITFDSNIRSREYDLDLAYGDYGEALLKEGEYLMEIKSGDAMPLWLVHILSELQIYPISFSKYGRVYANDLAEAVVG